MFDLMLLCLPYLTCADGGCGRGSKLGLEYATCVVSAVQVYSLDVATPTAAPPAGVTPVQCDVSSPRALRRAVDAIAAREGRIDHLVSNAGVWHGGAYEDVTERDFDRVVGINVKGQSPRVRPRRRRRRQRRDGATRFRAAVAAFVCDRPVVLRVRATSVGRDGTCEDKPVWSSPLSVWSFSHSNVARGAGCYFAIQAVLPTMRKQQRGSVVIIGSDQSIVGKPEQVRFAPLSCGDGSPPSPSPTLCLKFLVWKETQF